MECRSIGVLGYRHIGVTGESEWVKTRLTGFSVATGRGATRLIFEKTSEFGPKSLLLGFAFQNIIG
jgi:hypothetical protein